jgi:hypothetical protein
MNTLTRAVTTPADLRTAGATPREKSAHWQEGDVVQVDGVRWIIRILTDEVVELDAGAIWWRTTLDKLPPKVARP